MAQISDARCAATSILLYALAIGAVPLLAAAASPVLAAGQARTHGEQPRSHREQPRRIKPTPKPQLDFSGRRRIGIASFYADFFAGRRMADGLPMNPRGDNAASRTLPLGTIARVTNLKTHRSALVTIRDRGPYVQGRIVDLSPSTARQIGITRRLGIAKVRVTPIAIPQRDGRIKLANQPTRNPERDARPGERVALERQPRRME